jgi:TRAP-type C4-dicarboxylate transport system permease large subunit
MMQVSIEELYGASIMISFLIIAYLMFNFVFYMRRRREGSIDHSKTFLENFFRGIMP